MQVDFVRAKGRILCWPETEEDKIHLTKHCLGSNPTKAAQYKGGYSVEDTLVNRYILGLPYTIPKPNVCVECVEMPSHPLLEFQEKDLEKLAHIKNHLNGNRPGYGKTIEALSYSGLIGARRILILCPKSTKLQWYHQYRKWRPKLASAAKCSITPKKLATYDTQAPQVVITNWEQVQNDAVREALRSVTWDLIIGDEVHRIRNHKSKTAISVKTLPSAARIGLSGSPIMNKPDNIWGIFHWIDPWYFGKSYWQFVEHFCHIREDFWGKHIEGLTKDEFMANVLKEVLDLVMVRNPDNLVGNGMQESDIYLEMYPKQMKLYKEVKRLAIDELNEKGINIANGMSQLVKLQQLTSNPALFGDDTKANAKFEWIKDFIDDNPDLKIMVFSRWRQTILALNEYLGQEMVSTIHGGLSEKQREIEKTAFLTEDRKRVLSGTIGAMGEAIDGMQAVCHYYVFLDKMWNPEENNQALRRTYRGGQEEFVHGFNLMFSDTVDEKVAKINTNKLSDILAVLGE